MNEKYIYLSGLVCFQEFRLKHEYPVYSGHWNKSLYQKFYIFVLCFSTKEMCNRLDRRGCAIHSMDYLFLFRLHFSLIKVKPSKRCVDCWMNEWHESSILSNLSVHKSPNSLCEHLWHNETKLFCFWLLLRPSIWLITR